MGVSAQLDIQTGLRQEYGGRVPLVAIMKDGRVISSDGGATAKGAYALGVSDRVLPA